MMSPGGEVEVHAQQIRANKIAATLDKGTRVTVREDTISPQVFRHAMCTQLLKPQICYEYQSRKPIPFVSIYL